MQLDLDENVYIESLQKHMKINITEAAESVHKLLAYRVSSEPTALHWKWGFLHHYATVGSDRELNIGPLAP